MPTHSPYNEHELFLLIAEGDEKAFRQLFEQYSPILLSFLFRITKTETIAEELMQETMLRVWINRDKLPDVEHPRAWLYRIATNLGLNWMQKKLTEEKAVRLSTTTTTTISKEHEPIEDQISLKELQLQVKEAVNQLPPQRKLIYQLSREKGMSRQEIAAELNISESTVKTSLRLALRSMREYLEKSGYLLAIIYMLLIKK